MIRVFEADTFLSQYAISMDTETVSLAQAEGRSLREVLKADRDYPPFERVAMDGYALRYAAWVEGCREFSVEGLQAAGQAPLSLHEFTGAIEIMTGAKLPHGTDLVIRYEDTRRIDNRVAVNEDLQLEAFTNVHRHGEDAPSGSIFSEKTLRAPGAAIAASFGYAQIQVARLARITMLSTGDELVPIDALPNDYQIRESNIHAVSMALRARGHSVDARVLSDNQELIAEAVRKALLESDVLLLSGAVSAGKFDFVPEILANEGVTQIFHRVAQRPGKPLWFGQNQVGKTVFGLPGNPVSTLVGLYRYVLPFLAQAERGRIESFAGPYAELQSPKPKNSKLTHFVPVKLRYGSDGRNYAQSVHHHGSGDFAALAGTDGFLEIPGEDEPGFDRGQSVFKFYSWATC